MWLQKCNCGICKGGHGYLMVCHKVGLEDDGMSLEAFERVGRSTSAPAETISTIETAATSRTSTPRSEDENCGRRTAPRSIDHKEVA
ncbi:MAG: hypothetical protein L0K65_00275 [Actinomyces sp.]|nr:hypothetical protein [Actinomyces sp.]